MHEPGRQFALEIVTQLRQAGFEALWAGGCVRDALLGLAPKDYDVATSARPEEVRALFGRRRTLAIGAAFGVISVLGGRNRETGKALQIEVATFRSDGNYLDGRHPESVQFSTAEQDAQRRDFTINGLFFDPLTERVIDYVGGEHDLKQKIVRAIRNPAERFQEDKLRMLRAVRFAATYDFTLEPATLAAIRALASELVIVSAERVAAEMRRMLTHVRRGLAVELLREAELLAVALPEARLFEQEELQWQIVLATLSRLQTPTFATALATLLRPLVITAPNVGEAAKGICRRWKLSTEEMGEVHYLLQHEGSIHAAQSLSWPQLQRILVAPGIESLLNYCQAQALVHVGHDHEVQFCRQKLLLPAAELNPPPLLTGNDLQQLGLSPGPAFKHLLDTLRDAQLDKRIQTREEAIQFVKHTSILR